jgi:hypothetical protein
MTQDEIIGMATEAGGISYTRPPIREVAGVSMTFAQLEDFAKLVAQHEREACAKIFDDAKGTGRIASCREAAEVIRARGQA